MSKFQEQDRQLAKLTAAIASPIASPMLFRQTEASSSDRQHLLNRLYLSHLTNALPSAVFIRASTRDREVQNISEECLKLTGYTPQQLIGETQLLSFNRIIHADDAIVVQEAINSAIAHRQPYETKYRICDRLGEEQWLCEIGYGVFDANNQLLEIEGFMTSISTQKHLENDSRDIEKRFKTLLKNTPFGASLTNLDGVLLATNPALQTMLGYSEEELYNQHFTNFTHPDDVATDLQLYKELLANNRDAYQLEKRYICKNGQLHWGRLTVSIARSPLSEIQYTLATVEDITERKHTEKLLANQNRILEMIATDASLQTTLDMLIQAVEQQSDGMLGAILLLDPTGLYLHHGAAPSLPTSFTRAIDDLAIGPNAGSCGTAAYLKKQVIVENISTDPLWTDTRDIAMSHGLQACWASPIFSSQGAVMGTFSLYYRQPCTPTCHDLQLIENAIHLAGIAIEHKRAEQALKQAELKYRSIFENAIDGIFQSTQEGQYLTVNPMLAKIYGYNSPDEMMAKLTNIDQQLYVNSIRRAEFLRLMQESGVVSEFESQVYRQDGSIIWISESVRALLNERGQLVGYEGSVKDITRRKQAELELQRQDKLLQGIAEATNHLLTLPDLPTAVPVALEILAQAMEADRAYIFENHPHPATRELAMSVRFDWAKKTVVPLSQYAHCQNMPYASEYTQDWYGVFSAGRSLNGLTRNLGPDMQKLLQAEGVLAVMMVPIFIDERLWGFVGFDNCHIERQWSASEESMLMAIAASFGGAIKRQQTEDQMRYQAFHDPLTGLPNRLMFDYRLYLALTHAKRAEELLVVMFLDLDRFKTINDTLGHATGDQLLHMVTQRLKNCLREEDTIARWGGDEFTLILPYLKHPDDAAKIAQRIIDTFHPVFSLNHHELHITISIGIAIYPHNGEDAETLLKNADIALYRAKEQGRNNYQFYTDALNLHASKRLTLDNNMHHALEREEFVVYYQPQINAATGKITQMEALLRWQHPQLGLIFPQSFIALAEENGLIVPIGAWVLQAACIQSKLWQRAGLPPQRIAVNLSARQFQQPQLLEQIAQILKETGIDPDCLELEITETAAMRDVDFTTAVLRDLQKMGLRIALDDFGTGYSSLSYLKKFPLHTLKIDRSFVCDLTSSAQDAAIVAAIIALGQGLDLNVVAEGVETLEQAAKLRSLNCQQMQGYWFSQPLTAAEATQFLLERQ